MPTEKRTQIYLSRAQHAAASARAREQGGSLASVVRKALDHYLAQTAARESNWADDPLLSVVASAELADRCEDLDAGIDAEGYGRE